MADTTAPTFTLDWRALQDIPSADANNVPDSLPVQASVVCIPDLRSIRVGALEVMLPPEYLFTTDATGKLVGKDGTTAPRLEAGVGWTVTAQVAGTHHGETLGLARRGYIARDLAVGGGVVELADVWAIETADGITYAEGPQGPTGPQGPAGPTGPTGPANVLSIGTVASGTTAAATLTGTSPQQKLNLTLPAVEDTGWRDVSDLLNSKFWKLHPAIGRLKIRRIGAIAYLSGRLSRVAGGTPRAAGEPFLVLPAGFKRANDSGIFGVGALNYSTPILISGEAANNPEGYGTGTWLVTDQVVFDVTYVAAGAFPTTLPGTPA